MAKQSSNGHVEGMSSNGYSTPDAITTSKGATVRLIGLNPARLEKLQSAGKLPPIPKREIPNDLGESQYENLSEKDLQTDDERAAWAEYKVKVKEVEDKRNENVMKYVFNDGFAVDESEIDGWKKEEEEEWGLELPSSSIQLRLDFINAKVIGNANDLADIMVGVMERTGVPQEALDDVRATFRGDLRRSTAGEVNPEQESQK